MWNELERKCLLKPKLALKYEFSLAKALKYELKNAKKFMWQFADTAFPPRMLRIIRMAPKNEKYYLN